MHEVEQFGRELNTAIRIWMQADTALFGYINKVRTSEIDFDLDQLELALATSEGAMLNTRHAVNGLRELIRLKQK